MTKEVNLPGRIKRIFGAWRRRAHFETHKLPETPTVATLEAAAQIQPKNQLFQSIIQEARRQQSMGQEAPTNIDSSISQNIHPESPKTTAISILRVVRFGEQDTKYQSFNVLQQFGADLAGMTMYRAIDKGFVDPSQLKRIADFGAGSGGPTYALTKVAEITGATVDALETNPRHAAEIVSSSILTEDHVMTGDGIAYLNTLAEHDIDRYDLVTAFMLGPDINTSLFRQLAKACINALNTNGNLIITSDGGTLTKAYELSESLGVPFYFMPPIMHGDKFIAPPALVIPQSSCVRFARS